MLRFPVKGDGGHQRLLHHFHTFIKTLLEILPRDMDYNIARFPGFEDFRGFSKVNARGTVKTGLHGIWVVLAGHLNYELGIIVSVARHVFPKHLPVYLACLNIVRDFDAAIVEKFPDFRRGHIVGCASEPFVTVGQKTEVLDDLLVRHLHIDLRIGVLYALHLTVGDDVDSVTLTLMKFHRICTALRGSVLIDIPGIDGLVFVELDCSVDEIHGIFPFYTVVYILVVLRIDLTYIGVVDIRIGSVFIRFLPRTLCILMLQVRVPRVLQMKKGQRTLRNIHVKVVGGNSSARDNILVNAVYDKDDASIGRVG